MAQDAKQDQNPPAQGPLLKVAQDAEDTIKAILAQQNAISAQAGGETPKDDLFKIPLAKIHPEPGAPNPHSVPAYKKTSDGTSEFMGPLTMDAFKQTDFYQNTLKAQAEANALHALPDGSGNTQTTNPPFAESVDLSFGILNSNDPNRLVLLKSELGAGGKMEPRMIFTGQLDSASQQMHPDTVYDLKANQHVKVAYLPPEAHSPEAGISIQLSPDGALLQPEADKLAGKSNEVSKLLYAEQPHESTYGTDGKATVQISDTGIGDYHNLPGMIASDKMLRDVRNILDNPSAGSIKAYGLTMDATMLAKLDDQIDSGNFSKTLAITATDPAGKETHRVLLGNSEVTNLIDPVTGQWVQLATFTKSFNVDNGEASFLEKPIVVRLVGGSYTRQENLNEASGEVRSAVEKNQISMASPDKSGNPHFDALLAKGPSAVAEAAPEHGQLAPSAPSVSAGKKVASVA